MNPRKLLLASALFSASLYATSATPDPNVLRSTLGNGMRVVIVRNTLAPVATVMTNFLVGGNETPAGFPGMAHAEEHMAFRGCTGMSADQTAAIYALLGGDNNADTQQNMTQYYATVPATDINVALQAQAACIHGVDNTQVEWEHERGAIEQEVARDLSSPTYKFLNRLNEMMFEGTPYAHDPLGTKPSFDATTGEMLQSFYKTWYSPSNAILVIVGDVDPQATLEKVRSLYGDIPKHDLPARPEIHLQPVKEQSFSLDSNLPYVLGFVAYRMPGTDSADYAAAQILADVLASQRANLYAMVPAGKSLAAEFSLSETYPKASVGFGVVAQPAGVAIAPAMDEMKKILQDYATNGVPEDLVVAAKRSEISEAEFKRNSIPGLADAWSSALAAEGRNSPEEDVDAIRKVTTVDVNRVAKTYLLHTATITAILKPVPTGEQVASKGFGGGEKMTSAPTKPVTLPEWAASSLDQLKVPSSYPEASDTTLPNGIRLIVRRDTTSPTITLLGSIRNNDDLQTPVGQEGVSDLLDGLYSYGTQSLDRIAYQKALDDIAANVTTGHQFSLSVLKENFSRGVELLADNELHPALPAEAFPIVQQQTSQMVAANLKSPGYREGRALEVGLLPAGDPTLRETTAASVDHLTLAQVKQYHAATIRPDLTTIVVIGDTTPEEARKVVETWFGSWKAIGPKPNTMLPAVPINQASATAIADSEQVQDSVTLAQQLPINRFSPDYYPLQLGTHVLGGGFYATRLYHDLRQVAGYVYTVDVELSASKTRATYAVSYGSNPENVSKARALIEHDLNQMRTEPVSEHELHQAKALLLRQIPLSESSEEAVAGGMLARAQIGLPLDEPLHAAKMYLGLTAQQVQAAFQHSVRTDNLVQVVRGPAPK